MARRKKNIRSLDKEVGRPSGNLGQMKESRRKRSQQPAKFSNYVFKVLKQVHPQLSMTNKAMKVMDDFMHDIYSRLVAEAAGLVKLTRRSTLSASEFQTATRLILPGELAKHAINDASKAVANFLSSRADDAKRSLARRVINKITSPSASGAENNQEPVEIEIFGTAPAHRPLVRNSREVLGAGSGDVEESMEEEELVKSARSPHQALYSLKKKTPEHSENTESRPQNLDVDMSLDSNVSMSRGAISNVSSMISEPVIEALIHADMVEEDITDEEEDPFTALEESGPPTPPTESDNSIASGTPVKDASENPSVAESPDEDMKDKSGEEADTEPTDSQSTDSKEVEPNISAKDRGTTPSLTVHVEVTRRGNPTVISDVCIFDNSGELSMSDSTNISFTSNNTPIDDLSSEGVSDPVDSQILSLSSMENEPVPTATTSVSEAREAAEPPCQVTVRCSKVTTSKTTFIHERKEQISEWYGE